MDKITMVHRDSLSCEAIVRRLADGSLLLVSQCGGQTEPCPENSALVVHSMDDGESWSRPQPILPENGRAVYATDLDVEGGRVTARITEHNGGYLDVDCYDLVSEDGGYTWRREEIPCFGKTFVFLRGAVYARGIKLVAYQHYPIEKEENDALVRAKKTVLDSMLPAARCGALLTRDGGKSWEKSEDVLIPSEWQGKHVWQWPEPTIAALSEGYAMLLRVNGAGVLYRSDSADGLRWSKPCPTEIPNPNNKPKLLNLSDGSIALINTPNPRPGMKNRNPLEIWISDDDMRTWRYKKRVLDFPGWLSYPDGFAEGDRIRFAFELNRHDVYFADCDISDYNRSRK